MLTYAQRNRDIGMDAYREADYPKAAGAFRAALRQDPRDYLSHYYLGLSSLQLNNYQQAMVAFRSCLETQNVTLAGQEDNSTRIKSLEGLAQAIVKSDDSDQEVNRVEQAARGAKGPIAAREFFVLAKVYRYRMLPDMALDYYNRSTLDDPKNFDYAKEYALYCEQLQQTARAQEALRKAYALDATDKEIADALRRLGVVPGLSLKDKNDLAKPLVPKGPIPAVDMDKVKATLGISGGDSSNARPAGARTAASPRD
jgi:tetratricopeptide (TPR) repeat protein